MQRKSSESVLIDLARQSLVEAFTGGDKEDQEFPVDDETVSGVFVTLKRDGMIRGCRGVSKGPTLSGKPFGRFHAAAPSTTRDLIPWSRKNWKVSKLPYHYWE